MKVNWIPNKNDIRKEYKKFSQPSKTLNEHLSEWSQFLVEDAAKAEELPEDIIVSVKWQKKDNCIILFTNKEGVPLEPKWNDPIHAQMWISWNPECGGYSIQWVKASKGYGPLIYDIAMELVDQNNSWLMSDRGAVSPDAEKIWIYYDKHRNDVEKEPIGLDKDCGFRPSIKAVKYEKESGRNLYTDWEHHPLSYKWRKPDHAITSYLKSTGQLRFLDYYNKRLAESTIKKFAGKSKLAHYEMPVEQDEFIHFTTSTRAEQIITEGKLSHKPLEDLFGPDTIDAVSLTYGEYIPNIQTNLLPQNEGQIVGIKFKTKKPPEIGYVEEVKWRGDVELIEAKVVTLTDAIKLLENTPENKTVNKLEWGFVEYLKGDK